MTITEHMKELQNIVKKNIDSYKNIYIQNEFTFVKNNLTTLQRKIIYYSFSLLKNEDRELDPEELCRKEIVIELPKFLNLMNLSNKGGEVYNAIKREVKKIGRTPLEFKNQNTEGEIYWIDKAIYEKNENGISRIKIRFTYSICEFLTQFKNYVKYNYLISHSLKSKHSIKIYELLQSRKDTNTIYIRLEDFIHTLDLSKSYKTKSQLKKYVLEVAKKELNEKLNLGFDFAFGDKNSEYKNVLVLTAKKNDNDLTLELLTQEQNKYLQLEEQQVNEIAKNSKYKTKSFEEWK